jgi:hypothetical protein
MVWPPGQSVSLHPPATPSFRLSAQCASDYHLAVVRCFLVLCPLQRGVLDILLAHWSLWVVAV